MGTVSVVALEEACAQASQTAKGLVRESSCSTLGDCRSERLGSLYFLKILPSISSN